MCIAMVSTFEQLCTSFFGPDCTVDILQYMTLYVAECVDRETYDTWYEKWIGAMRAIIVTLESDCVINYGYKCDALFRLFSTLAPTVNILPSLPPFNITLIVSIFLKK